MKYIATIMTAAALAGTATAAAPKKAHKQVEVKSQPVVMTQDKPLTIYLHPGLSQLGYTKSDGRYLDSRLMTPAHLGFKYDFTSNYSVEAGFGQKELAYIVAQAGMPTEVGLKPYAQVGVAHSSINRYVKQQDARFNGVVGAGIEYSLNESVVVRLDGKVFSNGFSSVKDATPTISIGIGYRF
ncbi:MAG: hypothetical protein VXY77_00385 [Pseudomonadota bacterium]|nr:hypothetical protein [Pseudomonadota bacterium]